MTDREKKYEEMAGETMDEILAEASGPASPTLTPFVALGASNPGEELLDGPTTVGQAEARDLWQTFGQS
ncbi:MAG: hypothetical protein HY827_04980 [Actinobacteria bacterium]|nr:hypothetical protein [Actinomycetota bacterium]